jgi:outer membrane protein assembly factor BamB
MQDKFYTVMPSGNGVFNVVDARTGAVINRFNVPGQLVSGPVVSVGTCTITTSHQGTTTGFTIKLPTGQIINRYFMQ